MSELDKTIMLDEKTLDKLNIVVDRIIKEKKSHDFDYDFMEKLFDEMQNYKEIQDQYSSIIIPIKKDEILSISLNFFKSLDEDFFRKAVDIILNQTENLRINIYNVHKVKDFKKKDDWGMREYSTYPKIGFNHTKGKVYLPTQTKISSEESNLLNEEYCTLEDVYLLAHEIGHLFFSIIDKSDIKEDLEKTWELFTETVASSFEGFLTNFLISNRLFSESSIKQLYSKRLDALFFIAEDSYIKLELAREKEKSGEITEETLKKLLEEGYSVKSIKKLINNIVNDDADFIYANRYALAGAFAPIIIETYNKNHEKGTEMFKSFLKYINKGQAQQALQVYGIEMNEEGIYKLMENMEALDKRLTIQPKIKEI